MAVWRKPKKSRCQVARLFPGRYVHVGGDEVVDSGLVIIMVVIVMTIIISGIIIIIIIIMMIIIISGIIIIIIIIISISIVMVVLGRAVQHTPRRPHSYNPVQYTQMCPCELADHRKQSAPLRTPANPKTLKPKPCKPPP